MIKIPISRLKRVPALLFAAGAIAAAHAAPMRKVDPSLPSYQPQPVTLDKTRGYVLPDGSVEIMGCDDMAGIIAKTDALFMKTHPGIRFTDIMKGNGPAIPGITYQASALAPMCGGATLLQLLPYEKIHGGSKAEPVAALAIRVGHASLNPQAKLGPMALIVNKKNPIASLTQDQVTSIFAYGAGTGDITAWNQLDVGGPVAGKTIHPTGLDEDAYNRPEDLGMGEYMMYTKMGPFPGGPFSPNYERLKRYADVVERVAEDPQAIGLVALNKVTAKVRVVPLVSTDGKTLTTGSEADIVGGRYPYDRFLYVYARRPLGEAFDPLVREYLRLMLSKEGQQAIASDAKGYLPLSATELADERAKLDKAEVWLPRSKQGPSLNFPFPAPQP
jgi:phosphate transport system substrate-binding protein